jgi:hypothetical protein
MPDINWGGDSSTAPFSSRLDEANVDLILAEDNNGNTVLLEWDGTTWQYRGPVEMNGEDISGVGTLTAADATVSGTVNSGTVSTQSQTIKEALNLSRDDRSHWSPRSFEFSGPPLIAPHPSASNPELTQSDAGANADEVADPFVVFDPSDSLFHLFFEEILASDENIGHATSPDGVSWTYDQTIIDDTDHKAYPLVFKWGGSWYMTPDPGAGNDFDIWQADTFPASWSIAETPITQSGAGHDLVDPTPVYWDGRWYIFFNDTGTDNKHLWVADSDGAAFTGRSWSEHPSSPVVSGDATLARNAGRPIPKQHFIDFFSQNDTERTLRAHRITTLTPSSFAWSELSTSPIAQGTSYGWAETDIHHVDMLMPFVGGPSIAVVDGRSDDPNWSIGVYTLSEKPRTAFRMAMSDSNQTGLNSGMYTKIEMDTVYYDYGGDVDIANSNFTAPRSGLYYLDANLRVVGSSQTDYRLNLRVKRTTGKGVVSEDSQIASTSDGGVSCSGIVHLDEGETYSLRLYQDSGGTIDIESSGLGQYSKLDVIELL